MKVLQHEKNCVFWLYKTKWFVTNLSIFEMKKVVFSGVWESFNQVARQFSCDFLIFVWMVKRTYGHNIKGEGHLFAVSSAKNKTFHETCVVKKLISAFNSDWPINVKADIEICSDFCFWFFALFVLHPSDRAQNVFCIFVATKCREWKYFSSTCCRNFVAILLE